MTISIMTIVFILSLENLQRILRNLLIRSGAFTAVELNSYNAILAPLIYQKYLAAMEVKQKFFADLLQCTSIDVHCSSHLKKKKDFLFHSLIKIIQTYIILLFLLIQDLPCSCLLKPLFFFFIISSSSLISHQAPHPSDLSHQPSSLIKLSSPLNTKAKAVASPSPSPSRCRRQPQPQPSLSHTVASPRHRHRVPRRRQPQPQLYY